MMIKSLTLNNFRTHKDTELCFSPGVNVIVGQSGTGKTNILRALNWIVNNRPLGSGVIRRRKDLAEVCLVVEDQEEIGILRTKDKNGSKYVLCGIGDEAEFTSFGTTPPEPISEVLNLSDINIQKQFEAYFLVFESPGYVATYIRKVTKLDEIDEVVKIISGRIRKANIELQGYSTEVEDVKEKLEEIYKIDLDRLELLIRETELLSEENKNIQNQYQELQGIVEQLEGIEREYTYLPDDIDQIIENVNQEISSYQKLQSKVNDLQDFVEQLEKIEFEKVVLPEDLNELFSLVEKLNIKYNNIKEEVRFLASLIETFNEIKPKVDGLDEQIVLCKEEELQLMGQLEFCPYCNTELNEKSKQFLMGE